MGKTGAFAVYPLFAALGLGFFYALRQARKAKCSTAPAACEPYLCGENSAKDRNCFRGPLGLPVPLTASNYYILELFAEEKLTSYVNLIAGALLLTLIGGVL